jgi:predicted Zn-ribbon and HTH transcriptional regulator
MTEVKCPRCNSSNLFRVPRYFDADNQPVKLTIMYGEIPIVVVPAAEICRECGYVAMYLRDEHLSQIGALDETNSNMLRSG